MNFVRIATSGALGLLPSCKRGTIRQSIRSAKMSFQRLLMSSVSPARPSTVRSGAVVDRRIARAAGWDAGNRSMRDSGRTAWNEDDWDAACDVYDRLMRLTESPQPKQAQVNVPAKTRARRAA